VHVAIDILRYPYPYRCAFTICNDCDYFTRKAFETIHHFINTTDTMNLGKGLGLPIADSMFMFGERPGVLSYFEGVTDKPSQDSGFLKDAVARGWIDSLHGYGDFITSRSFSRELAERALGELEKNNIKLKVWIDHGSADMSQNIGLPNILSKGADRRHKAYHADLLKEYGIGFVAGYNSDLIGQDGHGRHRAKPLPQPGVPLAFLKRVHGRLYGRRLLKRKRLRDGSLFHFFCRARNGVLRPDASTLCHQLSQENIMRLSQSEGTMILYQHLGSRGGRPTLFPYLDEKAQSALAHVAEKYHDGILWVAPTSRLLTYFCIRENIKVEAVQNHNNLWIEIGDKENLSRGLDVMDLRDISFRVADYRGDDITIRYRNYTFTQAEYSVFNEHGTVIRMSPSACK
jgi:hypothetical protein